MPDLEQQLKALLQHTLRDKLPENFFKPADKDDETGQ
jgi:hypothetical protein